MWSCEQVTLTKEEDAFVAEYLEKLGSIIEFFTEKLLIPLFDSSPIKDF